MNKVFVIGRLTADPEQSTVSGVNCVNFTVASDTRSKDRDGNVITNFYRCTAWRGLGDTCMKFLKKGQRVNVVGDVVLRRFKRQDGTDDAQMQVTLTDVEFLGEKPKNDDQGAPVNKEPVKTAPKTQNTVVSDTDELPF